MELALILLKQVLMMFLLTGIGFLLFKTGKISKEGSRTIGNILLFISLPAVIVNSFFVERSSERLAGLAISAGLALLILAVSIVISRLFFKKDGIAAFAGAFSNPGFFGVPLIIAVIGDGAVFYIAAFIAFLNILQWSYGVFLLTGERGAVSAGKVLKAPFMIAILIGVFFFLTQLKLPDIAANALKNLANLNTPLAMFATGVYLAEVNLKKMFADRRCYMVSGIRLAVIPLIALALLSLVPAAYHQVRLAVLIAAACPVGTNVAVYASLHDADYPYAVETVIISTVLSVVTMPLLILLAGAVWQF